MKEITLILLLVSPLLCNAQKKIKTIEVSDTILQSYIDRPGDIYVLTKSGQIQKYDADGKLILLYKTQNFPTLFEPRDGARLFAYYNNTQHYEYLNPSFDVTKSYRIDSSFVIQPWLICTSGDHKLWVLDEADHSLKKINPVDADVEVEVVIDSTLIKDVTVFHTMRDYQGFVFLNDPAKGILVFSGMGKHIKTIGVPGIRSFNFLGEELYYNKGPKIYFFDLFSAESRESEITQTSGDILLSDQRMFHISGRKIEIFEYKP